VIVDAITARVSVIGIIEMFEVDAFPAETRPFFAFVQMTDGIGDYAITAEIHDLSEDLVLGTTEGAPVAFPNRAAKINCLLSFQPLKLTHSGRYDVLCSLIVKRSIVSRLRSGCCKSRRVDR
jgi:hypothetical protein